MFGISVVKTSELHKLKKDSEWASSHQAQCDCCYFTRRVTSLSAEYKELTDQLAKMQEKYANELQKRLELAERVEKMEKRRADEQGSDIRD